MMKKYSGKMYCFSPPVMLATFLFEFGALFYVLWRYKMSNITRLIAILLAGLGTFQLAEYMVCGGLGLHAAEWSRIGYLSITILPAVAIHLVTLIAGKKAPLLVGSAYISMIAFMAYFLLAPGAINTYECRPNYAVFNMAGVNVYLYSAYYYGWLLIGTTLSLVWAQSVASKRSALRWMTAGYLAFIVPTTIATIIDPSVNAAIPSVMCGFAVLLAIVLITKVAPLSAQRNVVRGRKNEKRFS